MNVFVKDMIYSIIAILTITHLVNSQSVNYNKFGK